LILVKVDTLLPSYSTESIAINTVVADSVVNENFGDNMVPLNRNDLNECFLFALYSEISCNAGQTCQRNGDPCMAQISSAQGALR
jgi:hypothetical protein